MPEIKPGHIVQGPRWPEPVELKLVEDLGDYIHLVGAIAVSSSLTTPTRTRPSWLAWSSSDSNSVTWPAASSLSPPGTRMQISEAESSVQSVKVC
jgi:hypothetical protein